MNAIRALVLALLCIAGCAVAGKQASPLPAAEPQARQDESALAGEYQLDGVMETGSGLLLRADGSFEWYFSYGALDLGARGKWTRKGDAVELAVAEMGFPPQMPETRFERMRLRIEGDALVPAWPWDMDAFRKDGERGRYQRIAP
jgi:hypothetical protein